uniref:Uncharacterized protein n=1 Tax=Eptatretus burgeri TaxID=7764 RepID=A0A8C4N2M2_EPTBU
MHVKNICFCHSVFTLELLIFPFLLHRYDEWVRDDRILKLVEKNTLKIQYKKHFKKDKGDRKEKPDVGVGRGKRGHIQSKPLAIAAACLGPRLSLSASRGGHRTTRSNFSGASLFINGHEGPRRTRQSSGAEMEDKKSDGTCFESVSCSSAVSFNLSCDSDLDDEQSSCTSERLTEVDDCLSLSLGSGKASACQDQGEMAGHFSVGVHSLENETSCAIDSNKTCLRTDEPPSFTPPLLEQVESGTADGIRDTEWLMPEVKIVHPPGRNERGGRDSVSEGTLAMEMLVEKYVEMPEDDISVKKEVKEQPEKEELVTLEQDSDDNLPVLEVAPARWRPNLEEDKKGPLRKRGLRRLSLSNVLDKRIRMEEPEEPPLPWVHTVEPDITKTPMQSMDPDLDDLPCSAFQSNSCIGQQESGLALLSSPGPAKVPTLDLTLAAESGVIETAFLEVERTEVLNEDKAQEEGCEEADQTEEKCKDLSNVCTLQGMQVSLAVASELIPPLLPPSLPLGMAPPGLPPELVPLPVPMASVDESHSVKSESDATIEVDSMAESQELPSEDVMSLMTFPCASLPNYSAELESKDQGAKRIQVAQSGGSSKKHKRNHKRSNSGGKKDKGEAGNSSEDSEEMSSVDDIHKHNKSQHQHQHQHQSHCGKSTKSGKSPGHGLSPSHMTERDSSSPTRHRGGVHVDLTDLSPPERIAFLQDKLQEIRRCYNSLKLEVASIDRRRKKMKRKERETTTTTSTSSGSSSESAIGSVSPALGGVALECR